MNKKRIIIIVIALVAIVILAILIYSYSKKSGQTASTTTTTTTTSGQNGLVDVLNNQGIQGWLSNIFGQSGPTTNAQDYGCDPTQCDPNKPGYNLCGDKWFACE